LIGILSFLPFAAICRGNEGGRRKKKKKGEKGGAKKKDEKTQGGVAVSPASADGSLNNPPYFSYTDSGEHCAALHLDLKRLIYKEECERRRRTAEGDRRRRGEQGKRGKGE